MYQKMKLTNLRHLETSKEEMGFIKGGDDDPELGPKTCGWACDCSVACIVGENNQQTTYNDKKNNTAGNSHASANVDNLIFTGIVLILF